MSAIKATFACGHTVALKGDETDPRCACGETRITGVKTRPPRFRGCVTGPHAQTLPLKAKAVVLKKETRHG